MDPIAILGLAVAIIGVAVAIYYGSSRNKPQKGKEKDIANDRVSIAKLPRTGKDLFGREEELELLTKAWHDPDVNVISLVAWGGVGKSALVNSWLAEIAKKGYFGAERVFAWTFYSQGASERQVSADPFIAAALKWFGDPDPAKGSAWDKGERLAGLVKGQRTLLILDGMEPLQYPPGHREGELKDPALQTLLKELAADNPGLCVVTSRVKPADLAPWADGPAPAHDLDALTDGAGAALLRSLGVVGEDGELKAASEEFGNHALAVNQR